MKDAEHALDPGIRQAIDAVRHDGDRDTPFGHAGGAADKALEGA